MELEVTLTNTSFVALHLLVSEITICISRGCFLFFFTRIILFITMFTVTIVVCSLKGMCKPSFS